MRHSDARLVLPALFVVASGCGSGPSAPMEPGKPFVVTMTGPAKAQGAVLLDLSDTSRVAYRCDYPVALRAQWGSAGETARWLGGSWEMTPLPGSSASFRYSALIPATAVPGYVGTVQLVSGQFTRGMLSTWITFPRTEPLVGTLGAHRARWQFAYTTPHMTGTATVTYEVDCLPLAS